MSQALVTDRQGCVDVQIEAGVAVLTIDRPPANALDLALLDELSGLFAAYGRDPEVKAVILTARGSIFVAGADLKLMSSLGAEGFERFVSAAQRACDTIEACSVPTIAALNGAALGGGLEMALACDIRFASATAKMGLPEAKLGLLPAAGGTQRLSRVLTKGRALELLYTGAVVDAVTAEALGLVERVTAPEALLPEALEFAAGLANVPRHALAAIKRCVLAGRNGGMDVGLRTEAREVLDLYTSAETQDCISAFVEKRPPRRGAT
jgi:enoyl-CoA hydratase/carnithine racemase